MITSEGIQQHQTFYSVPVYSSPTQRGVFEFEYSDSVSILRSSWGDCVLAPRLNFQMMLVVVTVAFTYPIERLREGKKCTGTYIECYEFYRLPSTH